MEPARVHITPYGCQMNQLDAELVAGAMRASGAEVVDDPAGANVLLFITCSVRGHAEDRVFSNIGALGVRKRREPGLVIGLLGCMAQQYGKEVRQRAPLVDVVCAPGRLAELPDLIARARAGKWSMALDPARSEVGNQSVPVAQQEFVIPSERSESRNLAVVEGDYAAAQQDPSTPFGVTADGASPFNPQFALSDSALDHLELDRPLSGASPGQAFVVVMRGCDNFCTYCVVPKVRGPERSRPPASVLEEVRRLVDQGARRVTLLGQAINKYRAVEGGRTWHLADLVAAAALAPGLDRLSFITSHPRAMTADLAAVFRDVSKVCPYLHMPAQSGSDTVLARMNRGYTAGEYAERVAMVRAMRPDVAVSSDFIVGFPGETEADFEATMDLVRRMRFSSAYVFKYSPRPDTAAAARLPDDVPTDEKRRRNIALLALVGEIAAEENQRLVGRRMSVFVEGLAPRPHLDAAREVGKSENPQLRSRTPCNRIVVFDGPPLLVGGLADVTILRAGPQTLFGKMAE
jgi:tRNA-2-methylthio-N6-dimethylallyladenosine synthase